jgi:hypothetical protein
MSMTYEKQRKIKMGLASGVQNIYMNAARFCWDSNFINDAVNSKIRRDAGYSKLPRHAREFIEGIIWHLDQQHWKLVEFSYEIAGVRMRCSEDRYRKVSPQDVCNLWLHTGCFVYRDNPDKMFTCPGASPALAQQE